MSRRYCLVLTLVCSLGIAAQSAAAITIVSQERSVQGQASATDASGSDGDSGTIEAPDNTPFVEGIGFTISLPGALGSGSATQNSELRPDGLAIHGSAAANAEGYEEEAYADASGDSNFEVVIEIDAPTPFTMSGYLAAYDNGWASLEVAYNGSPYLSFYPDFNDEISVEETGTLEPGTYMITAQASASAYGDWFYYDYGFGSFDVDIELSPTTPVTDQTAPGFAQLTVAPNPFSASTSISYRRPTSAPAQVAIFDLRGRRVRELAQTSSAEGLISWDSRDDSGRQVAPGLYFLRVVSGDQVMQTKITVMR